MKEDVVTLGKQGGDDLEYTDVAEVGSMGKRIYLHDNVLKVSKDRMSFIKFSLGFKYIFVVRGVNGTGGLGCLWDESIDLHPLSYSLHHVDFESRSDHLPILLDLEDDLLDVMQRSKRFKFESMWTMDEACVKVVQASWDQAMVGDAGETWIDGSSNEDDMDSRQISKAKLAEVSLQEEMMWHQRSKQLWLKEGDRNTRYFHSMALAHKKNNSFKSSFTSDNVELSGLELNDHILQFYKSMFAFETREESGIDLGFVPCKRRRSSSGSSNL
ncbi:hypothetical protein GH714_034408 [Hevea brasiliensis]|uniref:Uncharacterized protein n=1 Tax=Hevea brasiliensis TaxID=3981 RepID=A0A6A6NLP8_HEVBR|nr:hypothetical protein GH714_034408 [Hevea brasiliensis]